MFIMDVDDRIVRLRGDLATDAILGLEFTLHHPQHQTTIQTRRRKPFYALRKAESTSTISKEIGISCTTRTIQGPTLPIFSGETQAASGPEQGSLRYCREKDYIIPSSMLVILEDSEALPILKKSGNCHDRKKQDLFPFSLCRRTS